MVVEEVVVVVSQEQNWGREGKAEDSRGREGERAENSLATWENGDQKRIPTCAVKNEVLSRSRHTDGSRRVTKR